MSGVYKDQDFSELSKCPIWQNLFKTEHVSQVLLDLIFSMFLCAWVILFVSFLKSKIRLDHANKYPKDIAILFRKGISSLFQRCRLWCPLLMSTVTADPLSGCSNGSQRKNYSKPVDWLCCCNVWGGTWPLHLCCLVYVWRSERFSAALSDWFLGCQVGISC